MINVGDTNDWCGGYLRLTPSAPLTVSTSNTTVSTRGGIMVGDQSSLGRVDTDAIAATLTKEMATWLTKKSLYIHDNIAHARYTGHSFLVANCVNTSATREE